MKILASLIKRKLERQVGKLGHCAIYEDQLQRLWPLNEKNRRAKIAAFGEGIRIPSELLQARTVRHLRERAEWQMMRP